MENFHQISLTLLNTVYFYIGNFATYDTHMCCLLYEKHMKNICVSYAYLII